jgi:hypothetical protein
MVLAAFEIGKQGDPLSAPSQTGEFKAMRKFFSTLRRDDRGDQLVGWVLLVSFVVLVGAGTWSLIGGHISTVLNNVEEVTGEAAADDAPAEEE